MLIQHYETCSDVRMEFEDHFELTFHEKDQRINNKRYENFLRHCYEKSLEIFPRDILSNELNEENHHEKIFDRRNLPPRTFPVGEKCISKYFPNRLELKR